MEPSRTEHLDWCKKRAREYIDAGDVPQAVASMLSDLRKHSGTVDLARNQAIFALAASVRTVEDARRFVDGFN